MTMRRLISYGLVLASAAIAAPQAQQLPQTTPLHPPAVAPSRVVPPTSMQEVQPPAQQQQQTPPGQQPAQPTTQPAKPDQAHVTDTGGLILDLPNNNLVDLIDLLAKRLKINYILDPRVKGSVSIHTYGEVKPFDVMNLLMTVLRVNQATMVKVGDMYRIVPIATVSNLPMQPVTNADPKTLPDDEQMILNLVFLKYATAAELDKLIGPFMGEGATHIAYDPANLIIIEDNARSMKRTMELIAMFDSDTFAGQRVQLFEVSNSKPSDLVKDLENVFKAYALSEKSSSVKFLPVDRINTVIAVAPNPGIFAQVKNWIDKLDVPVKITAGAVSNYVYRLKYARPEMVAMAVMALYSGNPYALIQLASMANNSMMAAGMGYNGTGYGMGMMGGGFGGGTMGFGGMGMGGMGMGGMGYGGMGMGGYGMGGYGMGGYGGAYGGYPGMYGPNVSYTNATPLAPGAAGTQGANQNLTGSYLGAQTAGGALPPNMPHVIPNPFDNTLLIQGTPQDYESIKSLLQQLDVPPRQVLIDAKIYEVDLTSAYGAGVSAFLQNRTDSLPSGTTTTKNLVASATSTGVALTTGEMVLRSKELLLSLSANDNTTYTKVVSAPTIIATDGVPAVMNVGLQVPVLTSTVATGVQTGGNTDFANTISSQSTGITLDIMAHVSPSGIVTLQLEQQYSAPQAAPQGVTTASSTFSNRSIATQLTIQDGDTVALGGAILEQNASSSGGIPFLNRIPVVGLLFGAKSVQKSRTEMIILLTPRVIYDTTQLVDASDELKSSLKRVTRDIKDSRQ